MIFYCPKPQILILLILRRHLIQINMVIDTKKSRKFGPKGRGLYQVEEHRSLGPNFKVLM